MNGAFLVGSARRDITPPLAMPYLGFYPRHPAFEGVHDPLFLTALSLRAGEEVALVTLDGIGVADTVFRDGRSFHGRLRERAHALCGIDPEAVLVHSSHIHSSPDTIDFRPLVEVPGGREYLEGLLEKAAEAVAEARGSAFPAQFTLHSAACPGVSKNRRGDPYHDETLHLLRFAEIGGEREIVAGHFACHPVILQVQPLVSADFVGAFRRRMEARPERTFLFLQGADGDLNPVCDDTRDFSDSETLGGKLAAEAEAALASPGLPQEPALQKRISLLSIPSSPLPGEAEKVELDARRDALLAKGDLAAVSRLEETYARLEEGDRPFIARVSVLQIGALSVLAVPAEPLNKAAADWAAIAGAPAIVLGYTDGYLGYVAQPELWDKGGYEAGGSIGPWGKLYRYAYDDLLRAGGELLAQPR